LSTFGPAIKAGEEDFIIAKPGPWVRFIVGAEAGCGDGGLMRIYIGMEEQFCKGRVCAVTCGKEEGRLENSDQCPPRTYDSGLLFFPQPSVSYVALEFQGQKSNE
jgi:hypothetical protein